MAGADRGPILLVALLVLWLAAGCSATPPAPTATPPAPTVAPPPPPTAPAGTGWVDLYVALGDSFTAAPYVPVTDLAEGCLRSTGNYPSRLAERLDAELVDVSCSGADTGDIAGGQVIGPDLGTVPPQLRAVTADADLVTVGIGGNDDDLFVSLVYGCSRLPPGSGSPCRSRLTERYGDLTVLLDRTSRKVAGALERIQESAPDAVVVLVGYPRLVAADRPCPKMPLADGDHEFLIQVETQLNQALARAAAAAGAEFLDMRAVSEGHEVCSEEPWVNGVRTDQRRAMSFHPFASGQQAVADQLIALLAHTEPPGE